MPKKDKLFELLHALSPGDKKAYKAHLKGANLSERYIILFNCILKLSKPDNAALEHILKKYSWHKRLRPLKSELYTLLIEYLVGRRKDSSKRYKLEKILQRTELFYELRLNDDVEKGISKLESIPDLSEFPDLQLRLAELKLNFAGSWASKNLIANYEKIQFDFDLTLERISHKFEVDYLSTGMLLHMRVHQTEMDEPAKIRLEELATQCQLLLKKTTESSQLRLLSSALAMYYKGTGQIDLAFEVREQLFEKSRVEYSQGTLDLKYHLMDVTNYANLALRKDIHGLVPPVLQYFEQLEPTTKGERGEYLQDYYTIKLLYHLNTDSVGEIEHQLGEMRKNVLDNTRWMVEGMVKAVLYNIALAHLHAERYREALQCFYDLLSRNTEHRIDLNKRSLLLSTICHFELGDHQISDSTFRSAYNYCKKNKHLHPIEDAALKIIRSLRNTPDKHKLREALLKANTTIDDAVAENSLASMYFMNDIKKWISTKLEGVLN